MIAIIGTEILARSLADAVIKILQIADVNVLHVEIDT